MAVPAAGLINGHLAARRGAKECGVTVEVKASGSLSGASGSDGARSSAEVPS